MKSPSDCVFSIWGWVTVISLLIFGGALISHHNVTKIPQPPVILTDVCIASRYDDHYEITFQREGVYRVDQPTFNLCNDRMLRDPMTITVPRDPIYPNWYEGYTGGVGLGLAFWFVCTIMLGFLIPMIDIATQKDD